MAKILIADDEKKMRHLLSLILEGAGHQVVSVEDGSQAFDRVQKDPFDMVITDIKMPIMDGIELLQRIRKANIPCPVIVITAFATVDSAVETMRSGASDYITKPFDSSQILLAVERTLNVSRLLGENKALKDKIETIGWKKRIIFESGEMKKLMDLARNVAARESTVLIQGESGTGKELVARFVHEASPRSGCRFVPVNCAAISSSLVESELFGHEKGAFTGADRQVEGKFEYASRGTLFLDEIGDLPMETQAKLLRVLQEKKITRVGGNSEIDTDVRVICATNKDLKVLVAEDKFREDLYYRINVLPLMLPPLCRRRDDIIPLAEYFLKQHDQTGSRRFSEKAKQVLQSCYWAGNVRELANAVERGLILAGDNRVIDADVFSFMDTPAIQKYGDQDSGFRLPAGGMDLEKVISSFAAQALEAANGNQSEAARYLGITRSKFRVLIRQTETENGY